MSIRAEHLNHIYGDGTVYEQYALRDVNFEIQDGEFVGLIGHTGSGKSTLIQHLNGLLKASSGAIYYNGENIYGEGYDMRALRSKVGLVFQYPEHQLFEVDVFSDVCFGPKNQGLSKEEIEERAKDALRQVGPPRQVFHHYRELERIGLAAPQITYIIHELRDHGVPIDPDLITVEEARDAILALLGKAEEKEEKGKDKAE